MADQRNAMLLGHPQPSRPRDRVRLLGEFDLVVGGRSVALPTTAQRLTAFLALSGHPVARDHVAATLWPDASEARATGSLRSALWRLRRTAPVVEDVGRRIRLRAGLAIDAAELSAATRAITAAGGTMPRSIDQDSFVALVDAEDLLPDWDEDWLVVERERLRHQRLQALERLADALTTAGSAPLAVEAGLAAVRADPYRESARRALISAFIAEGNRSEAVRQFRSYETVLAGDLGIEPSTELEDLVRPFSR